MVIRYRVRMGGQAAIDSLAWLVGLIASAWLRYDLSLNFQQLRGVLIVVAVAVVMQNAIGHALFLYRGRYAFGSAEEVVGVFQSVAWIVGLLLFGDLLARWTLPRGQFVPISTPLASGLLALVIMLGLRYLRRIQRERAMRPDATTATPVLVFGAGSAGAELVRSMLHDPTGTYLPVGLLDDDPAKRNLRVNGVAVLGGRRELAGAVASTGAAVVVLAVRGASPGLVREIRAMAIGAGVAFKVLPPLWRMLDGPVTVSNVRDVDVTDLLGRGQVETDVEAIAGYLRGRRVLVTGAGGSIGSELCRQIHRFQPAELIMLDRDESALHGVQLSITGAALLDDASVVLADLRDAERISTIFAERRPHVVFHAAALKHQPLLEQYPGEAVKTNVWGTVAVLEAARASGAEVLVNISTDKAANPSGVLGYSKRIAERLTAHVAGDGGRYLSVRFGNVLGSRGSVLSTFAAQIAAGGPVTVTDPAVSRYFMTVQEAAQLVIQAGAIGRPGEALVLDMGQPVRIADVAAQMAALANRKVDIMFTGLRPGEKLCEELFGDGEVGQRPLHPLISHVMVPAMEPAAVWELDPGVDRELLAARMFDLCSASASPPAGVSATGARGGRSLQRNFN